MEAEEKYLPRDRNMALWKRNELVKKMEHEYYRWHGSAYGLKHYDVQKLEEEIYTGKTTFAKWKKAFAEQNIRANIGLGPNDPIPEMPKRKVKLENVSTEELENELEKRKSNEGNGINFRRS